MTRISHGLPSSTLTAAGYLYRGQRHLGARLPDDWCEDGHWDLIFEPFNDVDVTTLGGNAGRLIGVIPDDASYPDVGTMPSA